MSGIGGIIDFNEIPISNLHASNLKKHLKKRVYDEYGEKIGKNFFLCTFKKNLTPESLFEEQPFFLSSNSTYFLMDGRIDNREELISNLKLNRDITDIMIISLLYQKYEKRCYFLRMGFLSFDAKKPTL